MASLTSLTERDPPRVSGASERGRGTKISGSLVHHRLIPNDPDGCPTRSTADIGSVNGDAGLARLDLTNSYGKVYHSNGSIAFRSAGGHAPVRGTMVAVP